MLWVYLALFAYFINAIAFIVDKYLLNAPIPKPFAYAFWVAILSLFVVVLIPFGVSMVNVQLLLVALVSGGVFFAALIFLYRSIKHGDISVSATKVAVFTTIFSFIFSLIIFDQPFEGYNIFALPLLVVGLFLLSRVGKSVTLYTILAGMLFGFSFVLLKFVFTYTGFLNGIFWTRIGFIFSAVLTLFFSKARYEIASSFKGASMRSRFLFISNKALLTISFFALYYAIRLGDVTLIHGLMGFQFIIIFLLALLLQKRIPGIKEDLTRSVLISKIVGILLVTGGFLVVIFL
jgi:drug/metabolite transporter (DMT)-like permease